MLERLVVKNVALIDETEVEFKDGLNILTGETGAGKSILIDSIQLALGAKADKGLIRQGAEYAYVELCFCVKNQKAVNELRALEIFPDEEGRVLLQRRIMPSKSTCRINGETVSGKTLKDAAGVLIDLHGQHEHQSLLHEKKHKQMLDLFCESELSGLKDELASAFGTYREYERQLAEALSEDAGKDREIALAEFECKEIEEAGLSEGEDETLETDFRRMEHIRQIGELAQGALTCLAGYEQENAQSLIDRALKCVRDAQVYDQTLSEPQEQLLQAQELLRDSARFLNHYTENLQMDEEAYIYTRQRLDTINRLKSKYGNSVSDILSYAEKQREFLHKFENFEQYKEELLQKKENAYKAYEMLCEKADAIRRKGADELSRQMKQALVSLNFPYADFEIEVTRGEAYRSADGDNYVRFLISLNAGEALRPLVKVASGGELSRIMLGLKTVLANQDEIETLIFDEIDAGISGRTAWKVSENLAILGKTHQVICITHLAQIAAMADTHFLIEKTQSDQHTKTALCVLDKNGMVGELARLLGSDVMTETVLQNAKELKELADRTKTEKQEIIGR